jgi:hypothetical protein
MIEMFYFILIEPKYNKEAAVNFDSKLTPINLNVWSKGQWQPITKTIASNNNRSNKSVKQKHN